ncbi:hypothetical protein ONS96_000960 [Cadophora gregata f. sp. sojae]|nr:hypothetical protein ONS96_000960 [Cadophora gregata f. sp. sojae]
MFSKVFEDSQSQPEPLSASTSHQIISSHNPPTGSNDSSELISTSITTMESITVMPKTRKETPFEMFEVIPHLYLSKFPEVATLPHNITHILNMCTHTHTESFGRTILHIPIDDIDNIKPHIPTILDFISTAIQSGASVLVHCALGLNRSAAAILTYLCHVKQISSFEAVKFLKSKKPDVKPSVLFLRQIDQYYGREGEVEDPMVWFHRRLEERKAAAARLEMGNE